MTSPGTLDSAPAFVAVQLDERVGDRRPRVLGAVAERLLERSRRYATASPEWAALEETLTATAR
ncbi:hypothetical protein [Cellulomonas triticagri]|uniref:Uncharacterized protein n=1 Tax=Cellulomonas triticagri TaxID=2483352 RepID=A0A3M2J3V0_9CELL|nr:hypothetical protein [Cellulomonas triticagri]RMI08792.1 hypothetical protein EBM89_13015 [Cellulomonas triticagri]